MTHIEFPDLDVVHAPGCPFVAETFYDPGIDGHRESLVALVSQRLAKR